AMTMAPPGASLPKPSTRMSLELPNSSSDFSSPLFASKNQSLLWDSVTADSPLPHITPSNQSGSSVSSTSSKTSAISSSSSKTGETSDAPLDTIETSSSSTAHAPSPSESDSTTPAASFSSSFDLLSIFGFLHCHLKCPFSPQPQHSTSA